MLIHYGIADNGKSLKDRTVTQKTSSYTTLRIGKNDSRHFKSAIPIGEERKV